MSEKTQAAGTANSAEKAGDDGSSRRSGARERVNQTVTVACKLPHGIIIRDFAKRVENEPILGGGTREVHVFRPVGPKIRIKGPTVPAPLIRRVEVIGGYAITEGVPAEVFQRWIDWNKDSAMVRNKLIYGHENGNRVRDWAKDHAATRSGLEPIDVTMKSLAGRMVISDERVARAGAGQVIDGGVEAA